MKELVFYPTTRDGREGLWLKYTSLEEKYDEWKKWKEKKNKERREYNRDLKYKLKQPSDTKQSKNNV